MLSVIPICLLLCVVHAAVDKDEVTNLPGLGWTPGFRQYSGYLQGNGTKKLHYWFVESQNDPKSDPFVLWLNGGPGCSSMDGLLSEHGPFLVAEDGVTLKKNPYAWNTVANMLYLEAPAGVGYSYSADKDYATSDDEVSLNNYMAVQDFFSKFSEYRGNSFYITGESYGGVYVPTLSVRVAADANFNFKGFAVGNGLSDYSLNDNSLVYFGYYHGLFAASLWSKLQTSCCSNQVSDPCDFKNSKNPDCNNALNEVTSLMQNLNMYNLYDECHTSGAAKSYEATETVVINPVSFLFPENSQFFAKPKMSKSHKEVQVKEVPPCINVTAITTYMNNPDVRKAIHIPEDLPQWEICSGVVGLLYKRQYNTLKPQYQQLLDTRKYKVLVYNGDIDMACNFLGDQWFVDSLKQKVVKQWAPWYYRSPVDQSQQVAGFIKQFDHIDFVTIKGAGHMVPSDKPIPALEMFKSFIGK